MVENRYLGRLLLLVILVTQFALVGCAAPPSPPDVSVYLVSSGSKPVKSQFPSLSRNMQIRLHPGQLRGYWVSEGKLVLNVRIDSDTYQCVLGDFECRPEDITVVLRSLGEIASRDWTLSLNDKLIDDNGLLVVDVVYFDRSSRGLATYLSREIRNEPSRQDAR